MSSCAAHTGSEMYLKKIKFKLSSYAFENIQASCFTNDSSRFLTLEPYLSQIRSGFPPYVLVPK